MTEFASVLRSWRERVQPADGASPQDPTAAPRASAARSSPRWPA